MQDEHKSRESSPGQSPMDAQIQEGILSSVPTNRREFVKRLLVAAGTGVAAMTVLSVSEVMANSKLNSF